MKYLLFAGLLAIGAASCASPSTDSAHEAVSNYLKKSLNDPTTYQGLRWSNPKPYTRQDSAADRARNASYEKPAGIVSAEQPTQAGGMAGKLGSAADTTRIGVRLTHTYRAKNMLGATVLDSTEFLVYKNGQVQRL